MSYHHPGGRQLGSQQPDWRTFHDLLTAHGLLALNTRRTNLGATYRFRHQHSRIDFICVRQQHADVIARDVKYLLDMPFLPDGAHHIPQMTQLRTRWIPVQAQLQRGWNFAQRQHLCNQINQDLHHAEIIRSQMKDQLDKMNPQDIAHQFDLFHSSFFEAFPSPILSRPSCSVDNSFPLFKQFSYHNKALHQLRYRNLGHLFHAWRHIIKRDSLRRQMRQYAKQRKKEALQEIFQAAHEAECAHDNYGLFQAIRKIAPKTARRRIQLRASDGTVLGPSQAADTLAEYIQQLCSSSEPLHPIPVCNWPFSCADLCEELSQLPARKALDPRCLPAPYWIHASDCVAQYIAPLIHEWCNHSQHTLPSSWSSGFLSFPPKPGKSTSNACDVRPIALLEPLGKSAMGLIAKSLKLQVLERLSSIPQFA